MKKATIFAFLLTFGFVGAFAQDEEAQKKALDKTTKDAVDAAFSKKDLKGDFQEGWNKKTQFGVNFSGSFFNSGWKNVNSGVEGNSVLNFVLNHQNALVRGKNIWVNDFQGNIGFLSPQGGDFNRNVDKLFINSMFGREISPKLLYFVEGNFISQFLTVKNDEEVTSKNVKSAFMAPGYLTLATGIEYRPKDFLSIKVAPLADKITFVANNKATPNAYGYAYGVNVANGDKAVNEFGSQLTIGFNKEVVKNINVALRYNIFQAWKKELDPMTNTTTGVTTMEKSDRLKSLDNRLDLVATATINKYISANFTFIAIRDRDAYYNLNGTDWQTAGGFGIGLSANF